MRQLMKRWEVWVLAALVLGFCYRLAFTDLILARGDTFNYFYPYWDARSAALREGQLPLWSPELLMGSPLLAEPQLGTFYLPNWLVTPFSAPDAVRISILLHLWWAGLGAFLLFRQTAPESRRSSALLAGLLFALGGFLTAHVEQINQLQGMAWLPWVLWLGQRLFTAPDRRAALWSGLWLAAALALQFFSGHTQTVFITGVALLVLAVMTWRRPDGWRGGMGRLLGIGLAGIVTLALVLPQFLPTLELTGMSNRGGGGIGPSQATAFSLPPSYLARTLLPSYDGLLFTEYLAGVGVVGLGLALLGVLTPLPAQARSRWLWGVMALIGLGLAFGRYNPLYFEGLATLPGFNLFRAPARWLALLALGLAMLAGLGLEALPASQRGRRRSWLVLLLLAGLMAGGLLAPRLSAALAILPEDIVGGSTISLPTLAAWGFGLVALAVMIGRRPAAGWVIGVVVIELWGASQVLPLNDLVPRAVYLGQRFTISQLLAENETDVVPPRILSISQLQFDVGDRDRLRTRFEGLGMSEDAIQIAFTALKRQEMVMGNLPLTWGIQSADGYGGGILPTMAYSQYTSLLLPADSLRSVDGRIGEMMAQPACGGVCLPSLSLLTRTGITHLITDKIYDVWQDDVGYDTMRWPDATRWQATSEFSADEVRLLMDASAPAITTIQVNGERVPLLPATETATGLRLLRAPLTTMMTTDDWQIETETGTAAVAVSLVNTVDQTFLALSPDTAQRVLSSDVKLYELVAPRAWLAPLARIEADTWAGSEAALVDLRAGNDVLHLPTDAPVPVSVAVQTPATITAYSATRVVIQVSGNTAPNYLILADSWYPGWQATVNGQPAPVYRANVLFRAVYVPGGDSEIVFTFVPTLWYAALAAGGGAWLLWLSVMLVIGVRQRRSAITALDITA